MRNISTKVQILLLLITLALAAPLHAQWPKVYDCQAKQWLEFDQLSSHLASQQFVYVGEFHDHAWGHEVEARLLEAVFKKQSQVAIALEMFERDVQHLLDGYVAGEISEKFLLAHSRPWSNYQEAYRPLVEFARGYRLPVLAMNVPRRYAAFVARDKEDILQELPALEKNYLAEEILAWKDKYYQKFYQTMKGHVPPGAIERYYRAQCLKDDTMAKSIVEFAKAHPETTVISYTGSFHSNEGLGLVSKVTHQLPQASKVVITILPVEPGKTPQPEKSSHLADYLIFAPGEKSRDSASILNKLTGQEHQK